MSDYILLESADKQNYVRVVVHTAIPGTGPNSINEVDVKWRDALVGHVGDTTSVVPVSILPAGIQAKLDTGELYEWSGTVRFSRNLSDDDKLAKVETWVTDGEADELVHLQSILDYYGKIGTV